jgi:hypothetical protein
MPPTLILTQATHEDHCPILQMDKVRLGGNLSTWWSQVLVSALGHLKRQTQLSLCTVSSLRKSHSSSVKKTSEG